MILSGLFEADKAEAFAWDLGNLEVSSHPRAVQVVVVVSTINFRPRVAVVRNFDDPRLEMMLSIRSH